jgi:hypothetical protein
MPIARKALIGAVLSMCAMVPAFADSVNGLLLPGKLIEGHAKYESDCDNCHKQFDKAAQSDLCKNCHKDIAKDINAGRGYHGHAGEHKACKECHTEHKGRDAKIAKLDLRSFKHGHDTGFELKGGHLSDKVLCKDCHSPLKKYRDAPTQCYACHKRDDKHKGKLGQDCQNCHEEKTWKTLHFDHSKTHFPLNGKHVDVKCNKCHIGNKFKDTPVQCNACHRKDDKHRGSFGPKCETCHVDRGWKEIIFDHDKDTKYPLFGKHRDVKCTSCHKGNLYHAKLKTNCYSCHRKDDKHKGRFGFKCESCHLERGWKEIKFDHDRKTRFPLRGKHYDLKCTSCHKGDLYKNKLPMDCYSCHRKDDKHKGQEGKKCESCHHEQSWNKTDFDHRQSRFPLTGRHQLVECKKCHASPLFKDTKSDCWSCHHKDDVHKRRLGTDCEYCHNTRDWKDWDFDHDKTNFKLEGKHRKIRCTECHTIPVSQKIALPASCVSCHGKDDIHDGAYGEQCDHCHVGTSWKTIKVGSNKWIRR